METKGRKVTRVNWLLAFGFWLFSCVSCQNHQTESILPTDMQLKPGDVVFRRGEGITSHVVLTADNNGDYSHVGIVVDSCGMLMVVHAVPDEPDYKGDVDRVKMERPEVFFMSTNASIGAVCRPKDPVLARKASEVALKLYRQGVMFDHDYDETDTTRMYCTELVEYAFSRVGHSLADDRRHTVSLPFLHAKCILPSDIYESELLMTVKAF